MVGDEPVRQIVHARAGDGVGARQYCDDVAAGRVIVLNGTSSSGKTTLATTLQARLAELGQCWIVIGIDDILTKLPPAWMKAHGHVGAHAAEGFSFESVDGCIELRLGPVARKALAAYRASVSGAARAGLDVIVDEVVLNDEDWADWEQELVGLDVLWVRVDLDLATVEQRERARTDRIIGLARSQYDVVHRHPTYDVVVDTGALSPDEAAAVVLAALS